MLVMNVENEPRNILDFGKGMCGRYVSLLMELRVIVSHFPFMPRG